jgi:hypothetical protein
MWAACRARRASSQFLYLCVVNAFLSCSEAASPPGPGEFPPPLPSSVIESIDYSLIGSGKVKFERVAGSGFSTHLIDADARTVAQIPRTAPDAELAPTGDAIAELRFTDFVTAHDVYVRELRTNTAKRVSGYSGNVEGVPSWNANGTMIVFSVLGIGDPFWGITSVDRSGIEIKLRDVGRHAGPITCPRFAFPPKVAVSESGGLAYPCEDGGLAVAVSATDSLRVHYQARRPFSVSAARWSPGGEEVAFFELSRDSATSLKVLNLNSGNVRTILTVPMAGTSTEASVSLCWVQSGNAILFSSGQGNLQVVRVDGTGLTNVTTAQGVKDWGLSCIR